MKVEDFKTNDMQIEIEQLFNRMKQGWALSMSKHIKMEICPHSTHHVGGSLHRAYSAPSFTVAMFEMCSYFLDNEPTNPAVEKFSMGLIREDKFAYLTELEFATLYFAFLILVRTESYLPVNMFQVQCLYNNVRNELKEMSK